MIGFGDSTGASVFLMTASGLVGVLGAPSQIGDTPAILSFESHVIVSSVSTAEPEGKIYLFCTTTNGRLDVGGALTCNPGPAIFQTCNSPGSPPTELSVGTSVATGCVALTLGVVAQCG